ncbi:very short patch repair endonuclease [Rhizobium leguminosarum]
MASAEVSLERSRQMSLVRSRDSKPELIVRRLAYEVGYRFRLHRRDLPGAPDLTFPSRKKIIFVHGCFWHRHDEVSCWRSRLPKSRQDFWEAKLAGNVARDEKVTPYAPPNEMCSSSRWNLTSVVKVATPSFASPPHPNRNRVAVTGLSQPRLPRKFRSALPLPNPTIFAVVSSQACSESAEGPRAIRDGPESEWGRYAD